MKDSTYPKVTIGDIFRAYWEGSGPWKWWIFVVFVGIGLGNVVRIFQPIFFKRFFDALAIANPATDAHILFGILLQILGLLLGTWVLLRGSFLIMNMTQSMAMARLKQGAFNYLVQHSSNFFANNFAGSMVARVNRFTRAFEAITDVIAFNLMPLAVTTIGAVIATAVVAPQLSLVILAWVVIFIVANYIYARWRLKHNLELSALDSKATGVLSDVITNHSTMTLFAAFEKEKGRFEDVTYEHGKKQRFIWTSNGLMDAFLLLIMSLVEFAIFYYAIVYWEQGFVTIGTFVLLQTYVFQISNRQRDFGRIVRTIYEVQASATEMLEIMKLPHEISDIPGAKPLVVSDGAIEFKEVGFNFNETRTVFEDFNLSIPGGQKVALVGHSGAGKTTLVRLLLRLYNPTAGHVCIDDQGIGRVTQESLRRSVSFVPQEPVLFHRTLKDNILYGNPNATEEEMIEAAKKAHCHEFIDLLPDKYETYVGERGVKLSGGERQRVAIARAILKNAPILVLDEATSSLDSESEAFIQDALETLMQDKTVIVIAHRLSTIRKMDRIVVLREGDISEDGTHDELVAKGGIYARLWQHQAGGFILEGNE